LAFIASTSCPSSAFLELGGRCFYGCLVLGAHLVPIVLEGLFGSIEQAVGLVAGVGALAFFLVLGGVSLGFFDHFIDLVVI